MKQEDQQEKARADVLKAIRNTDWLLQIEMIGYRAKTARARYLALRSEGFSVDEALRLCLKEVEL